MTNLTQSWREHRRHLNLAIPVGTSGVHVPEGGCPPEGKNNELVCARLVQTFPSDGIKREGNEKKKKERKKRRRRTFQKKERKKGSAIYTEKKS